MPFIPQPPKEAPEYRLWRERLAGLLDEQAGGVPHRQRRRAGERGWVDGGGWRDLPRRERDGLDEGVGQNV